MKAFSMIWCFFIIVVLLFFCIMQIIDYRRTKDDTAISPEELKELKARYLKTLLILCAILIWDHVERLIS